MKTYRGFHRAHHKIRAERYVREMVDSYGDRALDMAKSILGTIYPDDPKSGWKVMAIETLTKIDAAEKKIKKSSRPA